jgi:hypothetical protein
MRYLISSIVKRQRWPWLKKSEPDKPWASLPLQVSKDVEYLLSLAIITEVGDGANTLFWRDKWLTGRSIQDLAPNLYALVPKRRASRRTVMNALVDENWVADIQGEIFLEALLEYLELWDILAEVELQEGAWDKHIWRLFASGVYTAKSAYDVLFEGAVSFTPLNVFGSPRHLLSAISLCGWLLTTGVGQQTGLLREAFPTGTNNVSYVIRRRTFNTYS